MRFSQKNTIKPVIVLLDSISDGMIYVEHSKGKLIEDEISARKLVSILLE